MDSPTEVKSAANHPLRRWLFRAHGVLITIGILAIVMLIRRFTSEVALHSVLLLAVVYATFTGGVWLGLISVAITFFGSVLMLSTPGAPLTFSDHDALHLGSFLFTAPVVTLIVGVLKSRADRISREALGRSEARFRTLVEGVKDYGILILDPTGRIDSWNSGAELMTGYQAGEVKGRPLTFLYSTVDGADDEDSLRHALSTASSQGRFESERWQVGKDGRQVRVLTSCSPLRTADGQMVGYSWVVRDLTPTLMAEEALRRSAVSRAMVGRMLRDLQVVGRLTEGAMFRAGQELASHQTPGTVAQGVESFVALGLGRLSLGQADPTRPRWTFLGDGLVEVQPERSQPTCNYTRGFLVGTIAQVMSDIRVAGVETACQSVGDRECVFVVQAVTELP